MTTTPFSTVDIDEEIGGTVSVGLAYLGEPVSGDSTDCPFYVFLVANDGGVSYSGNACQNPVWTEVPPGAYTLRLGGDVLPSVSVTVVSGETASHVFDVSEVAGRLSGVLTVNGQPPEPDRFFMCVYTSDTACQSIGGDGRFDFLMPAGSGEVTITSGQQVRRYNVEVIAGQSTGIGSPIMTTPTPTASDTGTVVVLLEPANLPDGAEICLFSSEGVAFCSPVPVSAERPGIRAFQQPAMIEITFSDIAIGQYTVILRVPGVPSLELRVVQVAAGQTVTVGPISAAEQGASPPPATSTVTPVQASATTIPATATPTATTMPASATPVTPTATATVPPSVVPVRTVDIAQPGTVEVRIEYLGQPIANVGCNLELYLYGGPSAQYTRTCATQVWTGVLPGSYLLTLSTGGSFALEVPVTVVSGETVTHTFEVSEGMGMVSGALTINGQPPEAGRYEVCVSTSGQACQRIAGDGRFDILVPAGYGFVTITTRQEGKEGGGGYTYNVGVVAGQTTGVGNPVLPDAPSTATATPEVTSTPGPTATAVAESANVVVSLEPADIPDDSEVCLASESDEFCEPVAGSARRSGMLAFSQLALVEIPFQNLPFGTYQVILRAPGHIDLVLDEISIQDRSLVTIGPISAEEQEAIESILVATATGTIVPTEIPPTIAPTDAPATDVPATDVPATVPPTEVTPTEAPPPTPTQEPTQVPSTVEATEEPTLAATQEPTSLPTDVPPTATLVDEPTAIPTEESTAIPTDVPPTDVPPTDVPATSVPTEVPPTEVLATNVPTSVPVAEGSVAVAVEAQGLPAGSEVCLVNEETGEELCEPVPESGTQVRPGILAFRQAGAVTITFENVPAGTWRLILRAPGFQDLVITESVTVTVNQVTDAGEIPAGVEEQLAPVIPPGPISIELLIRLLIAILIQILTSLGVR